MLCEMAFKKRIAFVLTQAIREEKLQTKLVFRCGLQLKICMLPGKKGLLTSSGNGVALALELIARNLGIKLHQAIFCERLELGINLAMACTPKLGERVAKRFGEFVAGHAFAIEQS